ncbi:hypothetical protein [Marinobacter sp.]|uniref:hypothetical protein n=1 Tax=Marinobacter sp. TaxID=50741 RepID=UPI003564CFB2
MSLGTVGIAISNGMAIKYGIGGVDVKVTSKYTTSEKDFLGELGGIVFLWD